MTNKFLLNLLGFNPDLTSRQPRPDSVSSPCRFRVLTTLLLCLIIGVGQMWANTTDNLTYSVIGLGYGGNNDTYTNFTNKAATSDARYAGQILKFNKNSSNSYIQLKSNGSSAGIVTTTSGGDVKKITITWNSGTTAGRTIDVYGKTSAYTAASDLYNNSTKGTLLGSAVKGTSTEITVTGSYQYIGIRSNSGALMVDNIAIEWSTSCTNGTITYSAGSTTYTGGNAISGSHANDTKVCSTDLTLPGATFTTTGYTQDGWATSDGGSKVYNLGATNYSTEGDATLYPHWTANNYTVTWMSNGSQHTTTSVAYGSKPTFPSNPSSCDLTSTTFYGWSTGTWTGKIDDISDKTIYTSASAMPNVTGDVTYHAVFAKGSANTFVKGTSSDLTEGQTVLIYNETNNKMMSSSGSGGSLSGITPSFSGTKITTSEAAVKWTVEISSTKFKFKQGSNYLWTYGSGNDLYCSTSYQDAWTVEASGGKYYIYYNSSTKLDWYSGFTCYGGTGNNYLMDFYIPEAPTQFLTSCCTKLGSINGSINFETVFEPVSPFVQPHKQTRTFPEPIPYPTSPYIYYVYIP